jgi:hypothetical protein
VGVFSGVDWVNLRFLAGLSMGGFCFVDLFKIIPFDIASFLVFAHSALSPFFAPLVK